MASPLECGFVAGYQYPFSLFIILDDYTAVNKINYDYGFGDNDVAEDGEDDEVVEDETGTGNNANVQQKSLFTNIHLVDDIVVTNMSHTSETDDSTEPIDEDIDQHALFKRDLGAVYDDGRTKRQLDAQNIVVMYQWFRDDQLLNNDLNGKDFQVYANGTLRIGYTSQAGGQYRCMASAHGLGRVLSTSCHVQQASKLLFSIKCAFVFLLCSYLIGKPRRRKGECAKQSFRILSIHTIIQSLAFLLRRHLFLFSDTFLPLYVCCMC